MWPRPYAAYQVCTVLCALCFGPELQSRRLLLPCITLHCWLRGGAQVICRLALQHILWVCDGAACHHVLWPKRGQGVLQPSVGRVARQHSMDIG